jgi:hypothetical protein
MKMPRRRKVAKKAVAKKTNGKALTVLEDAFTAAAGMGLEDITHEDMAIPTIKLASATTDEMKPSHPKYMEELKVGQIFNDVTKVIWSGTEGILVIPVYYRLSYSEFGANRTGFKGEVSQETYATATQKEDSFEHFLPSGNTCEKTGNHYVLFFTGDGVLQRALIRMSRTKLKRSRQWNTIMQLQTQNGRPLPMFANIYRLTATSETNAKGSWPTWSIALEKRIESMDHFNQAKEFHAGIIKGEVETAPPASESASETSSDEIPF